MGLFNKKEKTLEHKLVDKLVGSGIIYSQNLNNKNISNNDKMFIHDNVKQVWKDGGSCEDIQSKYDDITSKIPIINSNKDLVDSLVGTGAFDKGLLKELDLDYNSKQIIKKKVLSAWKNGFSADELENIYHDLSSNQFNEKYKQRIETKKKVNKELEYIKKHGEEKYLVNELVGAGWTYNSNISNMNISNNDKNSIHKTVKTVWKNGASKDEIQRIYDLTLEEINTKKHENELVGIDKVKNLQKKAKQEQEAQERIEKAKLKQKQEQEKAKLKADKRRNEIRMGVKCELAKSVEGTVSNGLSNIALSGLVFGVNKYSMALGALGSGSSIEHTTVGIPSTIKVVPKGVIMIPENDDEIRIPFDKIINHDEGGINLVGGQRIVLKTCQYLNEVRYLINESACGVDDEGWN